MKNKIKNFLFKKRFKILKNKRGLTLMEVMITLAIIGIVSAIALPQFNRYRSEAGYTAQSESLKNVAKAFNICATTRDFSLCDSLEELNIVLSSSTANGFTQTSGGRNGLFCADAQSVIGGTSVISCVSVSAVSGSRSFTSNQRFCYKDGAAHTVAAAANNCNGGPQYVCQVGSYDTTCTSDCSDALSSTPCTDDAQCTGTHDKCAAATSTGKCSSTTGQCA